MHPHLEHVRTHLERVRYGHLVDPSPENLYLGAEDDESFWELVGLRIAGCPMVVLALLQFRRLGLPEIPYSRESLTTHLSNLPAPRVHDEIGALSAILPPHDQKIHHFLRRLQSGLKVGQVTLDPARVELAFDFRLQNPTLVSVLRDGSPPLHDHYYRTLDGHVVRGRSHEIPAKAPKNPGGFVAIASPEQMTPKGVFPLPTLFMNRSYLALRARATTPEEAIALRNWVPFVADTANPASLLPIPANHSTSARTAKKRTDGPSRQPSPV